jgi:hypothetical protein
MEEMEEMEKPEHIQEAAAAAVVVDVGMGVQIHILVSLQVVVFALLRVEELVLKVEFQSITQIQLQEILFLLHIPNKFIREGKLNFFDF